MQQHWRKADNRLGLLFIAPFVVAALVFMVFPVAESIRMAFYYIDPLNPDGQRWAGLANFETVLRDPLFWSSLRNAAYWTFVSIILQTVIGVAFALLLHLPLRGISIFRGLLLFPYIVPTVVIALCWQWMLTPDGIVNHLLRATGLIDESIYWLSTPDMAMLSTIMLNVWKYTPFVTICVLARLQTVPTELYDAARVDGAGPFREFVAVTLPGLRGEIAVALTLTTIYALRNFDLVYITTSGGPGNATSVPAFQVFSRAFESGQVGSAAAVGITLTVIIFIISLGINRLAERST